MPPERKALARRSLWGALIGLGAGVILLMLQAAGWLAPLENLTWDWRARAMAGPGKATQKVKVVVLDQASLDWALKTNGLSWPWPRQVYAPIVRFLARGGAKAVALDIIFSEPSNLPGDDEALGKALAKAGMAVGAVMLGRSTGQFTSWPPGWQRKLPSLDGDQMAPGELSTALCAPKAVLPVEAIASGCRILGNVMEEAGRDQVIRRIAPVRWFSGWPVLTLGLAAYCPAGDCKLAWSGDGLNIGSRLVPLDDEGRSVLNFRGPPGTHEKFSAAAIIQSELMLQEGRKPTVEAGVFKDCYVIVGFTAPGLHELRATPLSSNYPGLEIHATALDNLLSGDFIRPAPIWLAGLVLVLLSLISGLIAVRLDKTWQIAVCFVLAMAAPVLLGLAAYGWGWWWPLAAPFLAVLLTMLGIVVLKYATEGRDRRFIKQVFRHYLSPEVIERILDDPSRLSLGGERRELSIYFSDLQGFTSISERMNSEDLTELLNDYLSEMTDIILAQGGTLDKYEGDAIIAFWNAPLDQPDHAVRAVRAALLCQKALADRQEEFAAKAGGPLKARIGLNTGTVVVGNLGSKSRFDYTVLGDAANLASRLEGANKIFGTGILISQTTWEQTKGAFAGRELGSVRVVGREEPVKVYEPLGLEGEGPAQDVTAFTEGVELMRKGMWDQAAESFHAMQDDPAAQAFLRRCRELMTQGVERWDGVWEQSEK
jgi:adenylate cyclase